MSDANQRREFQAQLKKLCAAAFDCWNKSFDREKGHRTKDFGTAAFEVCSRAGYPDLSRLVELSLCYSDNDVLEWAESPDGYSVVVYGGNFLYNFIEKERYGYLEENEDLRPEEIAALEITEASLIHLSRWLEDHGITDPEERSGFIKRIVDEFDAFMKETKSLTSEPLS